MMPTESYGDLRDHALRAMQALLGVISPNFRMVFVSMRKHVVISIVLQKEAEEDREEIEDVKSEFEALLPKAMDYEVAVVIDDQDLTWPDETSIVIYRRRED